MKESNPVERIKLQHPNSKEESSLKVQIMNGGASGT
jgi:hypothetical protein